MSTNRRAVNYADKDDIIISMRKAGKNLYEIGDVVGISYSTVSKRITFLNTPKGYRKPDLRNNQYSPTDEDKHRLSALVVIMQRLKKKTGADTMQIINSVFDLASQGHLQIKNVAH